MMYIDIEYHTFSEETPVSNRVLYQLAYPEFVVCNILYHRLWYYLDTGDSRYGARHIDLEFFEPVLDIGFLDDN